ncbi:hypothetical protein EV702DRAFT_1191579 [Suillus placidus]|uniref:Uncharacterized protein n=1 Tax=Suillus placidus TaxID=48579 RepID=A0A9P7A6H7_9AGAM|nr:hypothetical protein EV702DRAFT_1191579 [Suillus placidus]
MTHLTFLKTAAKCITKLTDKAKATLDEKLKASSKTSSKKRKNADSSVATYAQLKKKPSRPQNGPLAHGRRIKQVPPKVHQGVVLLEEEEMFDEEAIIISDSENDGDKGTITDVGRNGESAEEELKRLMKEWNSPIYAFFDPTPNIETVDDHHVHVFKCIAKGCKVQIRRFLDKKDAHSTSNMQKHVKTCWGNKVLQTAYEVKGLEEVRTKLIPGILCDGSITTSFECKGKGKVTYSHRQHTRPEMRAELVRWVVESLRPFDIIKIEHFSV